MKVNAEFRSVLWASPSRWRLLLLFVVSLFPTGAQASIFKGETLDKVADGLTWVVLIVAPIVGIAVFLLIHVLPEKIAEKRHHPQTKAIQCLCLLSLFFGGLLWPLAWLWAYTKPVFHKMAYGTDEEMKTTAETVIPGREPAVGELEKLRSRVEQLEGRLAKSPPHGGKA